MSEAGYSLGFWFGVPLMIVGVLILLVLLIGAWIFRDGEGAMALVPTCVILVFLVVGVVAYYPFGMSWHTWYRVRGTVQEIGSRQIATDNGMSTRYVFRIDGHPYGVDDTRASIAKVGDVVTLRCKREWQYQAEPGWACNWDGQS